MKAVMAAFDILAIIALLPLLTLVGRDRTQVLIYAWLPLPVWEFAGSGHIDAAAAGLLALALLSRRVWRRGADGRRAGRGDFHEIPAGRGTARVLAASGLADAGGLCGDGRRILCTLPRGRMARVRIPRRLCREENLVHGGGIFLLEVLRPDRPAAVMGARRSTRRSCLPYWRPWPSALSSPRACPPIRVRALCCKRARRRSWARCFWSHCRRITRGISPGSPRWRAWRHWPASIGC